MRQRLILIAIALVLPALAHADIARKCKDATYVFSQTAGCVKRPTAARLSPTETYVMALDALESEPKKAFGLFEKACREKHGAACTQVGMIYDSGRGRVVVKDPKKALDHYARACDLGDGRACQLRGNAATNANDYKLALDYFKRGCAHDDGIACAQQAWYVEKGFVDAPDAKAARALYDKGLRLIEGKCPGNGLMCHVRGYLYARGIGVVADPQKAQASYRLACAERYGEACGALAHWLDTHGGSAAEVTATYEVACELEVAGACSRAATRISNADPTSAKPLALAERGCRLDTRECGVLAELHRLGRGTQRDQDKATEIYRTACEAGDQGWCSTYGKRLHEGVGTKADTAKARKILDASCAADDSDACASLAIYLSNDKTADARAFTHATKACTLGAAHGCYLQAWMLEKNRHGGNHDAAGALPLYEKACGAGSVEACAAGGELAQKTDPAKARTLFAKGCDDEAPSGEACVSLAQMLLDAKEKQGAIRAAARGCARGKQSACDWLPNATTDAETIASATAELDGACKQGNDATCYALAMVITRSGAGEDKKRALAVFQQACRRKHVPSCEAAAQAHYYGIGTAEDKPKGEQLFRELCDADAGSSCMELARIAFAAKQATDTMRYAERACTLRISDGCSMVGFMYYTAQLGVRWDIAQAAVYFTKACDGGSGIGCANQAELVRFGINGPADPQKAFALYTKSCEAGQQSGCAGAALYTPDVAKARTLWRTACEADVAEACVELAASLEKARSGSPSEIARMRLKAMSITEKEAQSNPAYMYWLGTYHRDGMATVKDPAKALAWFAKACDGFDPLGCLAAGRAHAAAGDAERARVAFQRACAAGVDDGCKATGAPVAAAAGPAPVRTKSRGCSTGSDAGLALGLLAAALRRRRRA